MELEKLQHSMVVGLVRHDQGKIRIDDEDISLLPMHKHFNVELVIYHKKLPFLDV